MEFSYKVSEADYLAASWLSINVCLLISMQGGHRIAADKPSVLCKRAPEYPSFCSGCNLPAERVPFLRRRCRRSEALAPSRGAPETELRPR